MACMALRVSRRRGLVAGVAVVAFAVVLAGWWLVPRLGGTALFGMRTTDRFPDIAATSLDERQRRIVDVLREEFAAHPPGVKYSQGVDEPWCADFVSWVMRAAGEPLSNPNSGSWRIPGVYTLRDAYRATGRFTPFGTGYRPRTGDLVLYDGSVVFGQHVDVVLADDGGRITTIGGNELGKIRIMRYDLASATGVLGFGRL